MNIQIDFKKIPKLPVAVGTVLLLHLYLSIAHPADADATYTGLILSYLIAGWMCVKRSFRTGGTLRAKWRLVALSMLFNVFATLLIRFHFTYVGFPDFQFSVYEFNAFLRGIPLLLALVMPESNRTPGADSPLSLKIAGVQSLLFVGLSYYTIFFALPPGLTGALPHTIVPTTEQFLVEYGILAVAFTLRLVARSSPRWTVFYRGTAAYLVAVCFASLFASEIVGGKWNAPAGSPLYMVFDLVLLAFAMYVGRTPSVAIAKVNRKVPKALFVNMIGPVVFPLTVFALAVVVARLQFWPGIAAMAISLLMFAARTLILQDGYRRIQEQLLEDNQTTALEARVDQLTGVPNRRSFDRTLDREWRRAERGGNQIGLLMCDVDKFKHLNDTQGHPAGDRCLKRIAAVLDGALHRATDFVARYGGEEFVVILTDTSPQDIRAIAETLRQAVQAAQFPNATEIGQFVSISIGGAITTAAPPLTPSSLIQAADQGLYQAKRNGRNRFELTNMLAAPSLRDQTNGALDTLVQSYKEQLYGPETDVLAGRAKGVVVRDEAVK
jgi:diguanylate cyclase (GGDEF)-like protein